MLAAIPFPDIDPNLFVIPGFEALGWRIGPFPLRWYALAYIAGLVLGWLYVRRLMFRDALWPGGRAPLDMQSLDENGRRIDPTSDLLFWMTIGVVLGGRLGYVLFYEPQWIWEDPMRAIAVWEGGMAFHGGMLGVILGVIFYARAVGAPVLSLGDAVACATPFGLLFGRIANFINAELWGRVTDQPWGVVFPTVEPVALGMIASDDPARREFGAALLETVGQGRHPSQLYEAFLEGLVLLILLAYLAFRTGALKRPGLCTGVFLVGYGVARATVELWRQPDILKNTELLGLEITRGQLLSLPMVLVGLAFIAYAVRSTQAASART